MLAEFSCYQIISQGSFGLVPRKPTWNQLNGAFTPIVKSVLSENLGGILGGTQC
jgi:hypothetical protein